MKKLLRKIERKSAMNTNPGYSLSLFMVKKLRVLAVFVLYSVKHLRSIQKCKKVNRKVKASKQGKSALVIAGGPSAGDLNVKQILADQRSGSLEIFALNWYTHTKIASSITPDYYVLSDPINRPYSGETFRGRNTNEIWNQLEIWKDIKLVVPNFWYKQISETDFHIGCYVDDRELIGYTKNISISKPRGYCSMTAHKAIAAAVHLGYERIYLVGFDSSTFKSTIIDSKNQIYESINNLADSVETPNQMLNSHFPGGMSDMLYAYAQVLLDVKKCFRKLSVVNIQSDSYLDAFPKAETSYLSWD